MAAGCTVTGHVVRRRTVAAPGPVPLRSLAPQREFDGVVAGGDVLNFGTAQLIEAGEFFRGDVLDVDLIFAHLNLVIGDDVGAAPGLPSACS